MFEELNDYLIEQLKKNHIVCLLVDEVQNLSDESLEGLRLLSNLETDKEKLLQIVMMGQPEFKAKLDQPNLRQLKQRITLQSAIGPLKGGRDWFLYQFSGSNRPAMKEKTCSIPRLFRKDSRLFQGHPTADQYHL